MTRIKTAYFIHPVNFGGSIRGASSVAPSQPERPGSEPFLLEFAELGGFPAIRITKPGVNGAPARSTLVPMTNVSNVDCEEVDAKVAKK